MVRAIFPAPHYRHQATNKPIKAAIRNEVAFVPTFFDLQSPVRKVRDALWWRRHLNDFFSSMISGAVSLR